ncbi:MAG: serine/threonine protein kinase [Acidobacteria bacterium]|nr:serine/threonine protein kinase [Acidobacteriota bacterium]
MSSCPTCSASSENEATRRLDTPKSFPSVSYASIDDARFVAGAILAGRYRIVGLLGKGGMGEVYRADDLKLGQSVALKFLPDDLSNDGAALARFHREVRVARQVSHKNVCRVYDIGEIDGRQFLSMEYIKGEELSSLIRRIGRLPGDKALQLARQICAGLAAAHDNGVLHRDLKPANIMIDGDGNARILDFGLAGLSEEFSERDLASGTPAYMAPEQLAGKEQTTRTDVYSLGLVLYELFTGRKAFEAETLGDLIRLRQSNTAPVTPTSIVKDLDPVVERLIERCIQKDPGQRPESVLQVAAALPGGDPIAAALAAGETPSPQMVAASTRQGALQPAVATVLFASFILAVGLGAWLSKYTQLYRLTPLDKPPEVLQERARQIISRAGYDATSGDSSYGMLLNVDYLHDVMRRDRNSSRWEKMKTDPAAGYRYWFRQSPRPLVPNDGMFVEFDDPSQDLSGMTGVYLDMAGRLHYFIGAPAQRDGPGVEPQKDERPFDWSGFFNEAGLNQTQFRSVASTWVPLHAYDTRAAWDGIDPAHPDYAIHVEAATMQGRPVYFETIYPWDHPARQQEADVVASWRAVVSISIAVVILSLVGGALLAVRNLRLGLGDRRGAFRLASIYFALRMLAMIDAHHVSTISDEFQIFIRNLQAALFGAAFLWLLYIALEPFVRRYWPKGIISWSRLLAGDWRDPLVGRDVLTGALLGVIGARVFQLGTLVQMKLASPTGGLPLTSFYSPFLGWHLFVFKFTYFITSCLYMALFVLFFFLVWFILTRRERIAAAIVCLIVSGLLFLILGAQLSALPFALVIGLLLVGCLYRFGLLAFVSAVICYFLPVFFPHTTEFTAWYATDFTVTLAIIFTLVAIGSYTSLAGQSLPGAKLLRVDQT